MAGKLVHDPQYETSFTPRCPSRVVARRLKWRGRKDRSNQEVPQVFQTTEGN